MSTSLESAALPDTSSATASESTRPKIGFRRKAKAYLALTKPRVIELLLVTTLPTMIFAQRGWPDLWTVLATRVGGALAAGASGSFNCYIDRDIDKHMQRTKNRPLVTGEVTPRETLVFSWVLTFAAIAILAVGKIGRAHV